jgi:hypothetical protein
MPITGGTATKIADLDNVNIGVPTGLSLDPNSQQLLHLAGLLRCARRRRDIRTIRPRMQITSWSISSIRPGPRSASGPWRATRSISSRARSVRRPTKTRIRAASVWNALAASHADQRESHAVEQGARDHRRGHALKRDDGGYYTGGSIHISGGNVLSNESSSADDHLFVLDGSTQLTSGIFTGTSITVSYDSGTDTLTLSGYDTIAHYNTVLSAAVTSRRATIRPTTVTTTRAP